MARIDWNGDAIAAKVAAAAQLGTDKTMAECVADAKANHPAFPPASKPYERYANRTAFLTGSIRILDSANGVAGAMLKGGEVTYLPRFTLMG